MRSPRLARLLALAALAALVLVGTGATSASAAAPAQPYSASLADVSCRTVTFCLAVGNVQRTATGPQRPLLERWNGKTWRTVHAPRPAGTDGALVTIACRSTQFCLTVGRWFTTKHGGLFSARWNGTHWHVTEIATPQGLADQLYSVACSAKDRCVAVGQRTHGSSYAPLAEVWTGRTWHKMATAAPRSSRAQLSGVSCAATDRCVAVGAYNQSSVGRRPLGEVWNGKTWKLTKLPNPDHTHHDIGEAASLLTDISCTAPRKCVAVGRVGDEDVSAPLAERWNGTKWTRLKPAAADFTNSNFNGVTCLSATRCRAVGYQFDDTTPSGRPIAQRWQHGTWQRQSTQTTAAYAVLTSVSCVSATNCWSVGYAVPPRPDTQFQTVAEHWNGHAWTIVATP